MYTQNAAILIVPEAGHRCMETMNPDQTMRAGGTDHPRAEGVAAAVDAMRNESGTWRVKWSDGTERETTLVGLAWYAREFDPDAEVTPV
jgi:hypothetical protein